MRPELYGKYIQVLKEELVPALGCTEPIAVAYTAAYARNVLGEEPQIIKIVCSGNVIKNVKGVTVPNSDGMKGIEAAAALGTVGGDHKKGLEVLNGIKKSHIDKAKQIIKEKRISCELNAGFPSNFILLILHNLCQNLCLYSLTGPHIQNISCYRCNLFFVFSCM